MRRTSDPAATITALQVSLSRANERIRELEATSAAMAERMGIATERADLAEMHLFALQQAAQERPGANAAHADGAEIAEIA